MNSKRLRAKSFEPCCQWALLNVQIITLLFPFTVQKCILLTGKVHAGSFRVSVIHRTLTWTTGSLTRILDHSCACVYTRRLATPTAVTSLTPLYLYTNRDKPAHSDWAQHSNLLTCIKLLKVIRMGMAPREVFCGLIWGKMGECAKFDLNCLVEKCCFYGGTRKICTVTHTDRYTHRINYISII